MSANSVGSRPAPETVFPVRRSWAVRRAIDWVAWLCIGLIAFCAAVTLFFVAAFGHPLAMAVIGFAFAFVPLIVLASAVAVRWRGAVTAGRGRVGIRVLNRWRTVDVGGVRTVRFSGSPFGAGGGTDVGPARWGRVGWTGPGGDWVEADGDWVEAEGDEVPPALPGGGSRRGPASGDAAQDGPASP
jgi:hypothetical protein